MKWTYNDCEFVHGVGWTGTMGVKEWLVFFVFWAIVIAIGIYAEAVR